MNGLNGIIRIETPDSILGEVGMGAKEEAVGMVYNPRRILSEVKTDEQALKNNATLSLA